MSEIEIEKGPAIAGPGEAHQFVLPPDSQGDDPRGVVEIAPVDKVYNLSDEEIERQRAQGEGSQAQLGEIEVGK